MEQPNLTKLGKFLCLILRHKPEVIGITVDRHGWANVDELIRGVNRKYPFDRELLEEIVRTDAKQRYTFDEDGTKIRANQGHSLPVDLELAPLEPPPVLWHGSAERFRTSILEQGLLPQSRRQVHLSSDYETALTVGKRHGAPLVFQVQSGEMYRDGFLFYRAKNGVWLTDAVPPSYLLPASPD